MNIVVLKCRKMADAKRRYSISVKYNSGVSVEVLNIFIAIICTIDCHTVTS